MQSAKAARSAVMSPDRLRAAPACVIMMYIEKGAMPMNIRHAEERDLPRMMEIYARARRSWPSTATPTSGARPTGRPKR